MKKGLLLVISGPSGVGKGTLVKELLKKHDNISLSISETTRTKAPTDVHGVDYFFRSEEEFTNKIQEDGFLEWAKVFKNYYGTPKDFVLKEMDSGRHVILEIDVEGAMQVKDKYPSATFIFIVPPSIAELENRIRLRGRDSEEQILHRLEVSKKEMAKIPEYDFVVENEDLDKAVSEMEAIIIAEQNTVRRYIERQGR